MNSLIVAGARLAYRVDGPPDRPPLVLINSLGSDQSMWAPQVAILSERMRLIRYDIRGHGQSGVSATPATLARLADDLLALLDHLGVARAHICGLSLGGVIAIWLALQHPARVGRLVLANTAARIGSVEGWNARIAQVGMGGMAAVRELVLARFFSPAFRMRNPALVANFATILEAVDPAGYCAACAALRDTDLRTLVGSIRAPTLIIAGALDEATPPSQAEELHAAIAGSELVVLPAAGHLSNIEQPAAFTTQLMRFF